MLDGLRLPDGPRPPDGWRMLDGLRLPDGPRLPDDLRLPDGPRLRIVFADQGRAVVAGNSGRHRVRGQCSDRHPTL